MILTTTETAPGQRVVAVKGLVQGNTIRARHIGRDIMAGLRNIVGGEISEYTRLMTESRMQSTQRMIEEAEALGANAVVGVRFVTSMVISGASELLAYGTARRCRGRTRGANRRRGAGRGRGVESRRGR